MTRMSLAKRQELRRRIDRLSVTSKSSLGDLANAAILQEDAMAVHAKQINVLLDRIAALEEKIASLESRDSK
jgi:hypothetical protein